MFKKMAASYNADMDAASKKTADKAHEKYKERVEDLLLPAEQLIGIYGLAFEFCFVTSERLVFNDNTAVAKKRITSVFLKHIQGISMDSGMLLGDVEISTSRNSYNINLVDKGVCKLFYNDLILAMRNVQ
ncbi:PH domain-containing protein [Planococcus halocryophilus]|uniref:PH domain-containing protein n=1 Tax=Planococcus halocryophilus TaxID=1215089 RepID=UPI001F0F39FD|nr:PH domain-containing protein [Planococcus halocryophilus]MCH4825774.1 PH domain-containing protein [Planococcus halocryophilus]